LNKIEHFETASREKCFNIEVHGDKKIIA